MAGVTVWRRFAGRELERPAVGLGFVVERLALVAAELDDIFRLRWSELASEAAGSGEDGGDTSYASFRRRAEEEAGRYADDVASVEQIRRRIDDLESEARRCLDAGLLRPAYERAVQTLVPLDLLARRGELEPLERRRWLDEIRRLVVAVADAARSEAVSSESVSSETVSSGAVASGAVSSEEMPSEEVRSEAVSSEEMHSEAERSKVEEPADDEAESPEEAAIDQDSELADPAAEDDDA